MPSRFACDKMNYYMNTSIRNRFVKVILFFSCLLAAIQVCAAGSATWKATPANGDWNRPGNWMPKIVPNGPADTAFFGLSNQTGLALSAEVEVNALAFNAR